MARTSTRARSKLKDSSSARARHTGGTRNMRGKRYPVEITRAAEMRDLYRRLRAIGFDEAFLRQRVLPDWWDDALGEVPNNRAVAEAAISQVLGLSVAALRNPSTPLTLPSLAEFRLKRNKGTKPSELIAAVHVALRAARAVTDALREVPAFNGPMSASKARETILLSSKYVDLQSLVDFAWSLGIAVIHLRSLPKGKKFAGIATFCGARPVIILATSRDSAPWIAFHLAHELAHVLLQHVVRDAAPLIDSDIESVDSSEQEVAADRFACEMLTGNPSPKMPAVYGKTAAVLARDASFVGPQSRIHPGTYALVYGRSAGRMAVAQNALKILGCVEGGQRTLSEALEHHLNV